MISDVPGCARATDKRSAAVSQGVSEHHGTSITGGMVLEYRGPSRAFGVFDLDGKIKRDSSLPELCS